MKRFGPTQVGETATGDEIGLHFDPGRVWQQLLGADQREDGRLAIRRNPLTETALLLVDRQAESFLNVQMSGSFTRS